MRGDVLNPALYRRLEQLYGTVKLINEGIRCTYVDGIDRLGNRRKYKDHRDETYRVNCPFCGDGRGRLYISHTYAADTESGHSNRGDAKCYNENCLTAEENRQMLYDQITEPGSVSRIRAKKPGERDEQVNIVTLPGEIIKLTDLPANHQAITYLRHKRNFDIAKLENDFNVGWCERATVKRYSYAAGKIFIPAYENGELVGWQVRNPYDQTKAELKQSNQPKYQSAGGMRRHTVIYNYDNICKTDFVVLVEGPSDCWRVGLEACATFGTELSERQAKRLASICRHKPLILLYDGDAPGREASKKAQKRFAGNVAELIPINLPDGTDPGKLHTDIIWQMIGEAMKSRGYILEI